MRQVHHLALGLSALVLSSPSLSAQEYSFGGQLISVIPEGPLSSKDWLDGKPGAGVPPTWSPASRAAMPSCLGSTTPISGGVRVER